MADKRHGSRDRSHRYDRDRHRSRYRSRHRSRSRDRSSPRNRSRSRTNTHTRDRSRSRQSTRARTPTDAPRNSNVILHETLGTILKRLETLENHGDYIRPQSSEGVNQILVTSSRAPATHNNSIDVRVSENGSESLRADGLSSVNPSVTNVIAEKNESGSTTRSVPPAIPTLIQTESVSEPTRVLAEAIKSLQYAGKQNYFVSIFDPSLHDFDVWGEEVERARMANNWGDLECLSRVSGCLRGDARTWLNEWVTTERTWSNFFRDFKSLCPRKLDYANILYDAMQMNSDQFNTYAEFARRTLLRLKIVKGLSDELRVLIVIRGITDIQVRATTTNANLTCDALVPFLSNYTKPVRDKKSQDNRRPIQKRPNVTGSTNYRPKCFSCGQIGHKAGRCPKRPSNEASKVENTQANTSNRESIICKFCKKIGHAESTCFAKERSESRNSRRVNLCSELPAGNLSPRTDLVPAVVQGVPLDVLIDSGALNVSLVSSKVLKYFTCERRPLRCSLKGIGDALVEADSFVTLTIELDGISFEADFVIVPGSSMTAPIIIGTDILNRDGITYVRTKDKQYITRTMEESVYTVSSCPPIEINTPLEGTERDSLVTTINQFSDSFIAGTASSTVTTGKMRIEVTCDTPVAYRPYKLSHAEKLKVRDIVNDLQSKGIIRESQSEYASPILLVKKKDGSDRMCVDYRALNRITRRERYPLPLIEDHIDRLGNFKYFTCLDMATGFHQIPIDEESIHKTAFVTPEGHWEYLRMPYGLTNSPVVYQRIINDTLRSHINAGNVLVYVDDVLIMSNTKDEGIKLLKLVLTTLTNAGFSINLKKCSFLTTEVEYLGRVISQGQVRPSPRKVEALVNSPSPTNVKQVRQFLGLAGYFRRYIRNYAAKTTQISRLLKKDVPFHWGPEQESVKQEIVSVLTSSPVLSIFDPLLRTEVHTDASSIGYGAVLLQLRADGTKHVVAYFSKTTQGAESRYHSYELETLAVVRALQSFRHYLIGLEFKIVTDCNALKATEKKKDLLPRVARWWIYLQDFNFTIEYRKGAMMTHADYLSRNPVAEVNQISKPRNWALVA